MSITESNIICSVNPGQSEPVLESSILTFCFTPLPHSLSGLPDSLILKIVDSTKYNVPIRFRP